MDERGLAPQEIRSLEDIGKLPFTVKSDLRDTTRSVSLPAHEGCRRARLQRDHGKPIVVAYTKEDVDV